MGGYIHDDLKRIMELSNFESRLHVLELQFKSLDKNFLHVVQEFSQYPGISRQEMEKLGARMKWEIRAILLATGVGLGIILLIVGL